MKFLSLEHFHLSSFFVIRFKIHALLCKVSGLAVGYETNSSITN